MDRSQNWVSAAATIEEVRTRLATQVNSQYGSAMLYNVEILAKFSADGTMREQWITLSQLPKTMDDAKVQGFLLKGKKCFVRWKPPDPDHLIAEIN